MIGFNRSVVLEKSIEYVNDAIKSHEIMGNGRYANKCCGWMEEKFQAKKVLLTPSCTAALEMCAILLDIKDGHTNNCILRFIYLESILCRQVLLPDLSLFPLSDNLMYCTQPQA